jgi:hypothetical protein
MNQNAELSRPWIVREERFGSRVIGVGIAGDVIGFEIEGEPRGRDALGMPIVDAVWFDRIDEARRWLATESLQTR